MILIIANVLVMSMTHADMSDEWTSTLFFLNTVFAAIFLLEAILKLIAFGFGYFIDAWNRFDFAVVCSLVGFAVTS